MPPDASIGDKDNFVLIFAKSLLQVAAVLHISLYVCPQTVISSLSQAHDCFGLANHLAGSPEFRLSHCSRDGQAVQLPYARIDVDGDLTLAESADLLLLPATGSDIARTLADNQTLLDWLAPRPANQALGSLCSSAFLLAEAGQLDGGTATTHWALANQFRQRYPQVRLQVQHLHCQHQQRFTSGGAQAGIDLCLQLISQHAGPWLAEQVAAALVVDRQRGQQTRFQPLLPTPRQDDPALLDLLRWLQRRHAESIDLEMLAARLHCSTRTLLRRFKAATGLTPNDYLQRLRIVAAQSALLQPQQSLEQIALSVGYQDRATFSRLFKQLCGETPGAYRRRVLAP